MSQAIKEKLQGELDELESELRIHLPKEIKRALEFGDLRENSEYRAALDRQNVVKARIVELRHFGGLSVKETAEVLKVAEVTVIRHWGLAKSWLRRQVRGS